MNELTINQTNYGPARIQGPHLKAVLGGYKLIFNLLWDISNQRQKPGVAYIQNANVSIKFDGSNSQIANELGLALPTRPISIDLQGYGNSADFVMPISRMQLEAIEEHRGSGDLEFKFQFSGSLKDNESQPSFQFELSERKAASQWLKLLRDIGARDTLYIEVLLPADWRKSERPEIRALLNAEDYFRRAQYSACIAECRKALECLSAYGDVSAPGPLKFFQTHTNSAETMRTMDVADRLAMIRHSVRHFTHLAHHAENDGKERIYTRSEAQSLLTMLAWLIAQLSRPLDAENPD